MAVNTYTLTTTPIQISDGSKTVYIQEQVGNGARFTSTTVAPDSNTPYCTINDGDISLPIGFPLWAWTESNPITITVLTSEV